MNGILNKLMSARGRRTIYAVSVAAISLLVGYGQISDTEAPLWLALMAAVLGVAGPATALGHVTPDEPRDQP